MSHKVSLNPLNKKDSYVNRRIANVCSPSKKAGSAYSAVGISRANTNPIPDILPSAPFPHIKGKP